MTSELLMMTLLVLVLVAYVSFELQVVMRRSVLKTRLRSLVSDEASQQDVAMGVWAMAELVGKFLTAKTLSENDKRFLGGKLKASGFYEQRYLFRFVAFKYGVFGVCVVGFSLYALLAENIEPLNLALFILALAAAGVLSEKLLDELSYRRQKKIDKSIPEAVDLLVICLESGMSLDDAIARVADKISDGFPELSAEFKMLHTELQVLPDRDQALVNLSERSGLEDIRILANTILQAQHYGTPIAQALRVVSDENRSRRIAQVEENAAKAPAKMGLPMIVFILFPTIALIAAPPVINLIRVMSQ